MMLKLQTRSSAVGFAPTRISVSVVQIAKERGKMHVAKAVFSLPAFASIAVSFFLVFSPEQRTPMTKTIYTLSKSLFSITVEGTGHWYRSADWLRAG